VRTKKQEPSNQKPEKTNQQHSLALSDLNIYDEN